MPLWDIVIVVLLILLNGFFAMSELAVVASRKPRLQVFIDEGHFGAKHAMRLADEPGRFLSTVQIGITLVGICAGAFGGTRLAGPLADHLAGVPILAVYSQTLAFGVVVVTITYLSLIVGELVPKQLALRNAESIAIVVARPMALLGWLAAPLVSLLDASVRLGLRLLGQDAEVEATVTDEEITALIAEARRAGVVKPVEQNMIEGVMRLADRPVAMLMTPRSDIVWLDLQTQAANSLQIIRECGYDYFPVGSGSIDDIRGIVRVRDLFDQYARGEPLNLQDVLRDPVVVSERMSAVQALNLLKQKAVGIALVVDEYGSLEGLVSRTYILDSIVGELSEKDVRAEQPSVERVANSWVLDGGLPIDEVMRLLGWRDLPGSESFNTLAGLVLARLGHVPTAGETFILQGCRFEVLSVDEQRIERVSVRREDSPPDGPEEV